MGTAHSVWAQRSSKVATRQHYRWTVSVLKMPGPLLSTSDLNSLLIFEKLCDDWVREVHRFNSERKKKLSFVIFRNSANRKLTSLEELKEELEDISFLENTTFKTGFSHDIVSNKVGANKIARKAAKAWMAETSGNTIEQPPVATEAQVEAAAAKAATAKAAAAKAAEAKAAEAKAAEAKAAEAKASKAAAAEKATAEKAAADKVAAEAAAAEAEIAASEVAAGKETTTESATEETATVEKDTSSEESTSSSSCSSPVSEEISNEETPEVEEIEFVEETP